MNVEVFSESQWDEAALRVIASAILGTEIQQGSLRPRHRGWPSVKQVLPSVLRQVHYHTDAEALLVVVDSNSTDPHVQNHDQPNSPRTKCRLCDIRAVVDMELPKLRPVHGKPELKVALGLAIPSI